MKEIKNYLVYCMHCNQTGWQVVYMSASVCEHACLHVWRNCLTLFQRKKQTHSTNYIWTMKCNEIQIWTSNKTNNEKQIEIQTCVQLPIKKITNLKLYTFQKKSKRVPKSIYIFKIHPKIEVNKLYIIDFHTTSNIKVL